jgi:transcriptional regulator with XRE-family HTH domain
MNELRTKVRKIFSETGLSQAEFARRLGITEAYVSKIFRSEKDIKVSTTLIKLICYEFNVDPKYFNDKYGYLSDEKTKRDINEHHKAYSSPDDPLGIEFLIDQARYVFKSQTRHSLSLKFNIESFYSAVINEKKLNEKLHEDIRREIRDQIRQELGKGESKNSE